VILLISFVGNERVQKLRIVRHLRSDDVRFHDFGEIFSFFLALDQDLTVFVGPWKEFRGNIFMATNNRDQGEGEAGSGDE
jgi:hypothetical protein